MKMLKWSIFAVLCTFVLTSYTHETYAGPSTTKTFDVKKGGDLVVEIKRIGADIKVETWNKNEVAVKVEGISGDDLEWLEMEKDGNTVTVYFEPGNGWRRHRSARFYINVPSEFNVDVGTSGGDVDVVGSMKGTVVATTAGGDVEIDDVKGEVTLKTAGGDVTAGDVDGDAKLKTSGGDVEVGDVTGELVAATAGGDIEAGEVGGDLEAATAGGDIICKDVGGEAEAKTAGGDIELGVVKGGISARTAGGDIEVLGATGRVVAKTAGGDVELASVKGQVDAETAGGDISVELDPTNAGKSTIETNGGNIALYLPAGAKATVEAYIRLRSRDWDDDEDRYDVRSDFKAESHDKDDRAIRARYVINGGGKVIKLETTNGNIEIRKK
jgi:DUF4097 and DUF4098 domain-containing protein YvlB